MNQSRIAISLAALLLAAAQPAPEPPPEPPQPAQPQAQPAGAPPESPAPQAGPPAAGASADGAAQPLPVPEFEVGRVVRGEPAPPSPWQIQLFFTQPIREAELEADKLKPPSDRSKKFWNEMEPWERDHQCGGVIIAPDGAPARPGRALWALTAAHCLVNKDDSITWTLSQSRVRLGDNDLTRGTEMAIERAIIHAGYSRANSKRDDIVLLRLRPDRRRTVRAISDLARPAPIGDAVDAANPRLLATGWGITGERQNGAQRDINNRPLRGVKTLLAAQLRPVPAAACDNVPSLKGIAWAGTICAIAATAARQDTCQGDSGGPLMARGQLVGLVSTGEGCGRPGVPALYTNVTAYRDWIRLAARQAPAGRVSRCRLTAAGTMACTTLS